MTVVFLPVPCSVLCSISTWPEELLAPAQSPCEMLTAGVSLTIVAKFIGPIRQKQSADRHYGAWVKGRQEQLEVAVRPAFPSKFAATTGLKSVESKQRNRKIVKVLQKLIERERKS